MDKLLRVGVIGVGAMGRHHARVYSQLPDVQLVGVADVDDKLVSRIAREFKTKAFADYKELLREGLDAVSIVTPTFLHREIAIETINAGIGVLIEKPIADTVEAAEDIINRAHQKNVKLMVGHIERFNPSVGVMKKSLEAAHILSIDITRVGPLPPRITDVGVMLDLAVHDIDLIRFLTNSEFKSIYGVTSRNFSKREDTAILSFEMASGVLAHITTNWVTPFKVREISVSAKERFVRCLLIEQRVIEYSKYKEDNSYIVKELSVPFAEPLALELKAFISCLRDNNVVPVTGEDGLRVLEVVTAILQRNS